MSENVLAELITDPTPRKRPRLSSITVLAVLASLYTLYFAREFLLPIVFAILLDFLLQPAVRFLHKLKIPQAVGAGLVVLAMVGVVSFIIYEISGPVQTWVAKAPESIAIAQREVGKLMKPLERMMNRTPEPVEQEGASPVQGTAARPAVVVVQGPSMLSRAFGSTSRFLAAAFEVLILLYFMLAAGDIFLRKLIKVLPHLRDKLKAIRIARQVEDSISTYLTTTMLVNLMEGVAVSVVMWLLGMPTPLLWGVLVCVFEFIPYIGAFAIVVILAMVGLTTFGTLGHALLAPGAFLLINLVQANFLTPMLMSHRLALNPVAVFLGLAFWFWIWGIPGAFIGVPVMAVLKICCDQIAGLGPIGEFLGGKDDAVALPVDGRS